MFKQNQSPSKNTFLCNLTLNLMVAEMWLSHVTTSLRIIFCFVHIVIFPQCPVYAYWAVIRFIVSCAYCHVCNVYILLCFVTKCHFAQLTCAIYFCKYSTRTCWRAVLPCTVHAVLYVLLIKMFELVYRICLWEFFVSNFAKLIL